MTSRKHLFVAFGAALLAVQALAVTPFTADQILDQVKALPPLTAASTPFQRWAWTTMHMSATHCWRKAHPEGQGVPAALNRRPAIAGTWQSPREDAVEPLCEALAREGLQPTCTLSAAYQDGVERDTSLPLNYVQVGPDWRKAQIIGGLYCHLNSFQGNRQFYAVTSFEVSWTGEPRPQVFNTPSGSRTLLAGSAVLRTDAPGADGQPFRQPVTAVVTKPR